MEFRWAKSAFKHNIAKADTSQAIFYPRLINRNFKDSNLPGEELVGFVGSQRDPMKPELEVIILLEKNKMPLVIHSMHVRKSFEIRLKKGF